MQGPRAFVIRTARTLRPPPTFRCVTSHRRSYATVRRLLPTPKSAIALDRVKSRTPPRVPDTASLRRDLDLGMIS